MINVIKLIQHRITPLDSEKGEINITRTFHRDDYKSLNVVIDLLERGKKFENMWEEFSYYISGISKVLSNKMDDLEQKYFPKEEKINE